MKLVWLAAAAAQEEGAGLGPFNVEIGLVFWTWVVFLVLLFVLWKFAWPAIVQATEEREKRIQQQLAEAKTAHAEAQAAVEEGNRFAAEARGSAQQLLAEARQVAERERAQLLERARHEQEEVLERARREIAAERDKALTALRREAVELSLAAAAKLVGQRMDTEADRRLVADYLESVEIKH